MEQTETVFPVPSSQLPAFLYLFASNSAPQYHIPNYLPPHLVPRFRVPNYLPPNLASPISVHLAILFLRQLSTPRDALGTRGFRCASEKMVLGRLGFTAIGRRAGEDCSRGFGAWGLARGEDWGSWDTRGVLIVEGKAVSYGRCQMHWLSAALFVSCFTVNNPDCQQHLLPAAFTVNCTNPQLHSVSAALSVSFIHFSFTHCQLHSLSAALTVCCTNCQLHSMSAALTASCTEFQLHSL